MFKAEQREKKNFFPGFHLKLFGLFPSTHPISLGGNYNANFDDFQPPFSPKNRIDWQDFRYADGGTECLHTAKATSLLRHVCLHVKLHSIVPEQNTICLDATFLCYSGQASQILKWTSLGSEPILLQFCHPHIYCRAWVSPSIQP